MTRYAAKTRVAPEKSLDEIRRIVGRYGAHEFGTLQRDRERIAEVYFAFKNLRIKIGVTLPTRDQSKRTSTGRVRSQTSAIDEAHEQAVRQRWRALCLAIKAKLEAVDCGISTIEQEFMPFVVLHDGTTLGEHLVPRLKLIASSPLFVKALPQLEATA